MGMKLQLDNGTKVLAVHNNEFGSLEEIKELFQNMPKEMCEKGTTHRLYAYPKAAFNALKKLYKKKVRCWYWKKTSFEGNDYFQLYELVVD